jgi:7-cyano-7-deazaguanine synthase
MKTVLTLSGGMDSAVLLYQLKQQGYEVYALSVDYGQRHRRELDAAARLCEITDTPHEVADLSGLSRLMSGSALTDDSVAVPDGHYAAQSMKVTVVPNRNMLLLATAAAWAISLKADCVSYAAHAGDHTIYPDCRPEFADRLGEAIELADWHPVRLLRPFIAMTKAEIASLGATLGVPFAQTWSCYKGLPRHCGTCGTCTERKEAFADAGLTDPTDYFI